MAIYCFIYSGSAPATRAVLAGAIQIIGVFAFYKALPKEEVSRVIPLYQFTPFLVLLLSSLTTTTKCSKLSPVGG